ncbi:guanylate kinase [Tepidiforma sp.]|uniref:guanylate kinase n=1 Tax=Tepidiforma sp. TaxID=2682230 RepID=UPI002ADE1F62|nr:guanylate kinase [Tepidiforma sp.]
MEGGEEKPLVIVLHGPSGVGKDSVIDRLRERLGIHRATSSTTRPPRGNEVDGVHYHFLSEPEFRQKVAAGEFAEWASVYGELKGVERREIEPYLEAGQDVIIRTDVQGARTWRRKLEGAIFIFLTAEDREVLRARLIARGTEDPEQLTARLAELEEELADLPNNDYVVINRHGRLEEAVDEIAEIIEREKRNPNRPRARLVA